jgi:hypothetical protein
VADALRGWHEELRPVDARVEGSRTELLHRHATPTVTPPRRGGSFAARAKAAGRAGGAWINRPDTEKVAH